MSLMANQTMDQASATTASRETKEALGADSTATGKEVLGEEATEEDSMAGSEEEATSTIGETVKTQALAIIGSGSSKRGTTLAMNHAEEIPTPIHSTTDPDSTTILTTNGVSPTIKRFLA